jgi:hypothetical protein
MYQREALWLLFGGESWKPNAVMVGVGDVNALTGEPMKPKLQTDPQNYLVCPDQLWLDGIHSNNGSVRQFVSMPLGLGDTVEEQLSGEDALGGIQLVVYEPKPGLFPDEPPVGWMDSTFEEEAAPSLGSSVQMGLGAGGSIRQKVYPDKYGMETWDNANCGAVVIHIANSKQYYKITGQPPPATPVSARTYTEAGLPWFDLYDETTDDIPASERFQQVVPLSQRQEQRGERDRDIDSSLEIARGQVHKLRRKKE